ncbi:MAG: LysR family transcriptional regulator, partial [Clostridiales bacterium]|nr:LysR family transcriptional regulator [Clostridiales bacterium]
MLDINLKQLEVFVTAAEYGSFTRAADVLYLSQSTVSSHIRGLEETLGSTLFDRSAKRKVALTETGERIYPTAREIVDRCRVLQKALPETVGAMLTVGASTVPAQDLVPRLLADFARQR